MGLGKRKAPMTAEEAAFEPTVVTPRYSSYALRRLRTQAAERARAARRGIAVALPLIVAVLLVFYYRDDIPGPVIPVRIACTVALVILGWRFARDVGRAMGPTLLQRLEPGTAGTVEFLIRLATVGVAVLAALRVAGLRPETLAVGGAMTAVVLGLAAQQTFGNLVAGVVLLSARPFRVGERISLQGAGVNVEGEVASLGLLHTTLASGQDNVMIPNSLVLSVAIIPLREPASVDLRARLRPGVKPSDVQTLLDRAIETPVRGQPHISLEEVDDQEVIVRIEATPESDEDGPRLADEVLTAVESATREPAAAGAGTGTGTGASRD